MMTFPKEFKAALTQLPAQEKDKLIIRLLKKDLVLANRLLFELLGDKSVEEERKIVKQHIKNIITKATNYFYSPGYFMLDMRYASGYINDHVSRTRDKYGDAWLNLYLLKESLLLGNKLINSCTLDNSYKWAIYVLSKVYKILIGINKLHEDFLVDFRDDLMKLGKLMSANIRLTTLAQLNGLKIDWLIVGDIPTDIAEIYKRVRANGALK